MTTRQGSRGASNNDRIQRAAARKAASKLQQNDTSDEAESQSQPEDAAISARDSETDGLNTRPAKRRKTAPASKPNQKSTTYQLCQTLFGSVSSNDDITPITCSLPSRAHPLRYHRPLLLSNPTARASLLAWFDKASPLRSMPWRKPWIDPSRVHTHHASSDSSYYSSSSSSSDPDLRALLAQRAYEVWISEIMLQQTRVQVVRDYWTRWMARWPSIADLAGARPDEVLAAWQGLGYYSRAARVHAAARMVCADPEMRGLLPRSVDELRTRVPGVGRYTAGAIAAIVFGVAAAMVDGNVLRVLSRQLGVLGDVKGDRRVVEVLWEAAEALVKVVARDGWEGEGEEPPPSDRPGRWGQALMELGSTVCTPKPNCSLCPITATCRAYCEGRALAAGSKPDAGAAEDMEDLCSLCAPFEEGVQQDAEEQSKPKLRNKQESLSPFFATTRPPKAGIPKPPEAVDARTLETIINHAKKFPPKKPKKEIREEEALVCAIRRSSDGRYLLHRRPDKGLLAGMWELPSHTLPESNNSTPRNRKTKAVSYVSELLNEKAGKPTKGRRAPDLRHVGELGSVPWLFSHLKLTMHVHLFELDKVDGVADLDNRRRWAVGEDIDKESMGTGMKKCWSLVKESTGNTAGEPARQVGTGYGTNRHCR
ncbi:hypothetical protein VTK56DRAFT_3053 [Thermocarpiscus australiensis]